MRSIESPRSAVWTLRCAAHCSEDCALLTRGRSVSPPMSVRVRVSQRRVTSGLRPARLHRDAERRGQTPREFDRVRNAPDRPVVVSFAGHAHTRARHGEPLQREREPGLPQLQPHREQEEVLDTDLPCLAPRPRLGGVRGGDGALREWEGRWMELTHGLSDRRRRGDQVDPRLCVVDGQGLS